MVNEARSRAIRLGPSPQHRERLSTTLVGLDIQSKMLTLSLLDMEDQELTNRQIMHRPLPMAEVVQEWRLTRVDRDIALKLQANKPMRL